MRLFKWKESSLYSSFHWPKFAQLVLLPLALMSYLKNYHAQAAILPDTLATHIDCTQHQSYQAPIRYRRALAGRQELLGEKHPHTLTSLSNIGMLLKAQGKLEN